MSPRHRWRHHNCDCVSTLLRLGSVQVALQRLRPSREAPVCEREGEAGIVTPAHLTLSTEHCRLRQEAGVVTRPRPPEASVIRRHLSVHSVDSMMRRCNIVHNARKQPLGAQPHTWEIHMCSTLYILVHIYLCITEKSVCCRASEVATLNKA